MAATKQMLQSWIKDELANKKHFEELKRSWDNSFNSKAITKEEYTKVNTKLTESYREAEVEIARLRAVLKEQYPPTLLDKAKAVLVLIGAASILIGGWYLIYRMTSLN